MSHAVICYKCRRSVTPLERQEKDKRAKKLGLSLFVPMTVVGLILTLLLPQNCASGMVQTSLTPIPSMILSLTRISHSKTGTFGVLSVDGHSPICTLENRETQIPSGTYSIDITYSPRFKRPLPLLNIPHRHIRIHSGNWPRDAEGCILVGLYRGDSMILGSRAALDPLIQQIQIALAAGRLVQIEIRGV